MTMIGPVRHNPSTVVVLAGNVPDAALAIIGHSLNVVLVRPGDGASGPPGSSRADAPIEAAAGALRRAAGVSAPYVLVAADPLAGVAEQWRSMWQITAEPRGSDEFELRAAEALAAWRAKRFELPDYYLVLAEEATARAEADFYLGPLRSVRPHRVAVAAATAPAEQAAAVLAELGSLRHGPWWPPLEEIIATARGFFPGSLAESPSAGHATLLG
jgi:hypothetical protein